MQLHADDYSAEVSRNLRLCAAAAAALSQKFCPSCARSLSAILSFFFSFSKSTKSGIFGRRDPYDKRKGFCFSNDFVSSRF